MNDVDRAVLDHAWNWFSLHSGQRMQLLSFFFVALALLLAGYTAALDAERPLIALGVSVAGVAVALAFGLIDYRTATLIKASEAPLAAIQERLATASGTDSIELIRVVERARPRAASYGNVIRSLLAASALLMGAGVAYAIVELVADGDQARVPGTPHAPQGDR